MRKEIVMTVCQRPFYLKPVLDAWEQVEDVENWDFTFMVENTATKDAMLDLIRKFDHPSISIIENEKRLGVLVNPREGLNLAFTDAMEKEFVVLAEEDLLPSVDVLNYFNHVSEKYRNHEDVLMACVNPISIDFPPGSVRKMQVFSAWIWGTWTDRWPLIHSTWDSDYSSGGQSSSGWDWNLHLRVLPQNNKVAVFPDIPLVDNLGQFLGAHAQPDEYENSRPVGFDQFRKVKWS